MNLVVNESLGEYSSTQATHTDVTYMHTCAHACVKTNTGRWTGTCAYRKIHAHLNTYIHSYTVATIAASVGTYAASSVTLTTTTSSTTYMSGAFGVVQHAQFVAIAGKVGSAGSKARRRRRRQGSEVAVGEKTGTEVDAVGGDEGAQPEGNAELSGALSWINFHWIDLSSVTKCISVDGTDL
jgi:hypothetical protein